MMEHAGLQGLSTTAAVPIKTAGAGIGTGSFAPVTSTATAHRRRADLAATQGRRVAIILLVLAVGLAFVAKGYQLFQATMLLSYAVALVGLNLLTGYNGQISLGHGAFYAIGAYTAGILIDRFGLPYPLAIVAAGLVSLGVGYAFGRPALKLEGLYLALATFALGVVMPQLLKYRLLEPWTGGVGGIVLTKPEAPVGLPLDADQWLYLFALAVTALLFLVARNLIDSGSGRSLRAIRDHALAAEAMGLDNAHVKSMIFGISAAYTGIGGALAALAVQFVAPDSFNVFLSISLLVGIVVGGVGTLYGALFGAAFIIFVPSLAEKVSKAAPWAVYGVVLILFMFVMPGGVMGLIAAARRRLAARREARSGGRAPSGADA